MNDPSGEPVSELDILIAEWLDAVERGEQSDRDAFIAAHPEHAEGLRKYFADEDRMKAVTLKQQQQIEESREDEEVRRLAGTTIADRYKLLEIIGTGGMGTVWLAEQKEPVKRKVAVKLIKPGMDSKQVLARFEAERQALAMMDHPCIAKVFDGGTTDDARPYFVMEYVRGVPFTNYCDRAKLSLKERLELFIPVCQAIQHAHHKGIVHRDLKPANILVGRFDGKVVPKVIDFGLAKACWSKAAAATTPLPHGPRRGGMDPEELARHRPRRYVSRDPATCRHTGTTTVAPRIRHRAVLTPLPGTLSQAG